MITAGRWRCDLPNYTYTFAVLGNRRGNRMSIVAPNAKEARQIMRHLARLLRLHYPRLLRVRKEAA